MSTTLSESKTPEIPGVVDIRDKEVEDNAHIVTVDEVPSNTYSSDSADSIRRETWGSKFAYILSSLGFAVGLGNIWRFPYLCFVNGGGAFLIPYFINLIIAGFPLFFMESALGQFASQGCISIWGCSPLFKGIGFAMANISALVGLYYVVILAWTNFYTFAALTALPGVPWQSCDNLWNTKHCVDYGVSMIMNETCGPNQTMIAAPSVVDAVLNMTGFYDPTANETAMTYNCSLLNKTMTRPSEEFWTNYVLEMTDGIDNLGGMRWELVACHALSWIIVTLCIIKGVKSSGKVVYFTAPFPYFVLIVLLVRGVTLPGSLSGILFYITPQWKILKSARVWKDAATQVFYSLGIGWGGLPTLGSYNKFKNNCYRDSLFVATANCATSIFAGFVIFSIIGFMAHDAGLPIDQVVDQGAGLAFIVYPEAVARLPMSALWAILFFIMMFTLGLDSQFVMMETVTTAITDELAFLSPRVRKNRSWIILGTCFAFFLLGLPMVTAGGIYILQLLDWYAAGFSLCFIGLLECIVIAWVYGIDKFCTDIEAMIGYKPNRYLWICWKYLAPATLAFIMVFSLVSYTPCQLGDYVYPKWAEIVGWIISLLSVALIPAYAIYHIVKVKANSASERICNAVKPLPQWGPALAEDRLQAGYPPIRRERHISQENIHHSMSHFITVDPKTDSDVT
ncbi:sodium- and chloride-dependent glycine transporter 1-like [Glandiceps talaboti]